VGSAEVRARSAMATASTHHDPRDVVTPDAFEVSDALLGMPLASPGRRLAALLIDLAVIGFVTLVTRSFALVLGLWVLGPTLTGLLSVFGQSTDPLRSYMWFHPAFQTELLMSGASGVRNAELPLRSLRYGDEHVVFDVISESLRFAAMTKMLLGTAAVYMAAAAIFFWRARCRLRRSVFR